MFPVKEFGHSSRNAVHFLNSSGGLLDKGLLSNCSVTDSPARVHTSRVIQAGEQLLLDHYLDGQQLSSPPVSCYPSFLQGDRSWRTREIPVYSEQFADDSNVVLLIMQQ
eukprot:gb/GEZN01029761.1/.p1 GENE.gb/GEZN01029761.1/~~gb/GEZN01029761.1/.p1  ORF type:complete len:120 (+),score=9.69 gb/GEZN01029761.1/:34-360(+)